MEDWKIVSPIHKAGPPKGIDQEAGWQPVFPDPSVASTTGFFPLNIGFETEVAAQ